MQHEHAFWNWAALQLIRDAVRQDVLGAPDADDAIAELMDRTRPNPTIRPLLDPQREPLAKRLAVMLFL
jgi:hypothetical protein